MVCHPCILGSPQQKGQNQKSKTTLGVTMMRGSLVQPDAQIAALR